jgi:hypothetical protein
MPGKKIEKPQFTLEVASVVVQVQVLVRNAEGKVADTQTASVTIMSADLDKHNLPAIAADVERQLTERMQNPTKVEG